MPSHSISLPRLKQIVWAKQTLEDAEKAYLRATSPSNASFDATLLGDLAMKRLDAEEFLKDLTGEERPYVGQFYHFKLRLKCRKWVVERTIGQLAKQWRELTPAQITELGMYVEERATLEKL